MKINTYAVNCNDAWLNTEGDDISGSYVKYKDHQDVVAELEVKCAVLAAENARLKAKGRELLDEACKVYEKFNTTINPETGDFMDGQTLHEFQFVLDVDTPATDAYLAEVRAQGVELFFDENPAALGNGNIESLRERFLPKIKSGEIGWGDYLKRKDADLQEAAQ